MKLTLIFALSLCAAAQAPPLATFSHAHLGSGEVTITGSLADPILENHTTKTIHAATVQLKFMDGEKSGPGPVVIVHGSHSDIKPDASRPVLTGAHPLGEDPYVSVVIHNVTFADGAGGGEFVGTDRGGEFNLVQRELAKRNITVYRKD